MNFNSTSRYAVHPLDVLTTWLRWNHNNACLVLLTATEGGGVRPPGALMVVAEDGSINGYISGGCVDADIVLHAQKAIETKVSKRLIYGPNSPFKDLSLPCGGALEVCLLPAPNSEVVLATVNSLSNRTGCTIALDDDNQLHYLERQDSVSKRSDWKFFNYFPKLKLHIAGRGPEIEALALIASTAGYECAVTTTNDDVHAQILLNKSITTEKIATPKNFRMAKKPDAWTAFVLSFHDIDWEGEVLKTALESKAFYVGAVGSKRTHKKRLEALELLGVPEKDQLRIRGPIGAVPSMRDAYSLSVSILAEIVGVYQEQTSARFVRCLD